MPVMVVVNVAVLVLDWLMHVFVAVPFRQVQEEPERPPPATASVQVTVSASKTTPRNGREILRAGCTARPLARFMRAAAATMLTSWANRVGRRRQERCPPAANIGDPRGSAHQSDSAKMLKLDVSPPGG